jgi:hypothetical protein
VLVYGAIPGTAVLASIPLLSIIANLPSYLVRSQAVDEKISLLDKLRWHSAQKKPSYRQFCQDVSQRFLLLPDQLRLRETTTQSVRLAVALLRPWFHEMVHHDLSLATSKLSELAFIVGQWPGQWWARDHEEMWDLICHMVCALGEEVREQQRLQISREVQRLHDIIGHLTQVKHETSTSQSLPSPSPTPQPETPSSKKPVKSEPPVQRPTTSTPTRNIKPTSITETVSRLVRGFLFGAFFTICILSTQRRTHTIYLT